MPALMSRILSRPAIWMLAAFLLCAADMIAPARLGLPVLNLVLLTVSWRLLHRRHIAVLTLVLFICVAVGGVTELILSSTSAGEQEPTSWWQSISPVRIWVAAALVGAGWFHINLQHARRRRLMSRRELQQRVRRRTAQVQKVNQALRIEVARREETEHLLDRSETTFKAIMDRMELQITRKDCDGVITYANETYCSKLGRAPEEVVGCTDAELYPPEMAQQYREDDLVVIATGKSIDQIEEHPLPDGSSGFAQVFKAPEHDQSGQCIGVQIIFWDITRKHRSEIELRNSEARKRALFESAGDAVLLLDDDGRVVEANPSAVSLLELPAEKFVGKPVDRFASIAPEYNATNFSPPRSLARLDNGPRHELLLQRSDGSDFISEVSIHSIPVGNREGLAVIIRDVTLQRRAFQAMSEAKSAAEAASETKTEFMASVSHELRTPLGGVIGLADLLATTPLSDRGKQYVDLIRHSASLLSDVIEDILDFSALEAGHVHLDPTNIDLHKVVGDAYKCVAARAIDKPIRLVLSIAPATPRYVVGDAKRLRQIVINLCGNAIKFTPRGEVALRLSTAIETNSPPRVVIEVKDSGIGIPEDKHASVFEAFEQGETGTTKRFGGTGLGLAITRGLALRMGGDISLNSELGKGSTFRCVLLLPNQDSADQDSAMSIASKKPTAQLSLPTDWCATIDVESKQMRDAFSESLRFGGLQLIDDPRRADVIIQLHGRPRRQLPKNKHTVWIARLGQSSPSTVPGDIVLLEPVTPEEIVQACIPPNRTGQEPDDSSTESPHSGQAPSQSYQGTLLIVDDSEVNRTVLRDQLQSAGYKVEIASSGFEGVAKASTNRFDCILMDLQMPDMDGIEATEKITTAYDQIRRPRPPIIALTAHVTAQHRERCKHAGMDGFVTKPVAKPILLNAIAGVVSKQQTTDSPENPPSDLPPPRTTLPEGQPLQQSDTAKLADQESEPQKRNATGPDADPWRERLQSFGGNDPVTVISICDAFLQEVPRLTETIERSHTNQDASSFRTAAHTLKSCLRYVAPADDVKIAAELEQMAAQIADVTPDQLAEMKTVSEFWVIRVQTLKDELSV